MKSDQTEHKPWLNDSKQILGDAELKEISKAWAAETWEEFLSATVDCEQPAEEVPLAEYESLLEQETESIWSNTSLPEAVEKKIKSTVRALPLKKKLVVKGLFYMNLTQQKVAQKLQITQSEVNRFKTISLNEIKDMIQVDPIISSYLIGGSQNQPQKAQSRDHEIYEVYMEDCKGSYHL